MSFSATLRNWTIAVGGNGTPHAGQRVVFGSAYGHTSFEVRDGHPIRSNVIVGAIENGIVRTASGSTYTLEGEPCADFAAWLAQQKDSFQRAVTGYSPVSSSPSITEV